MQINTSPRFIKNFTLGLIASSVGAFVALPSTAMPEPSESLAVTEVEGTAADSVENLPTPAATETLLSPKEILEAIDSTSASDLELGAVEAEADVDLEVTESEPDGMVTEEAETDVEAADAEMTDDTVEADAEMMDDTVEADAEMTDDTVEADAEMTDDMVEADAEADAEMMDDTVEADAEMMDDTVEADAEMTDDMVEADAEMTDEAVVEGETDETTDPEATASEEINTADFTIAELTDNSDSFTILAAALKAADLTEVLSEEGPYTIFAPTDEAFQALPEGAVQQLLLPENKDVLVQVLTYHVIPGAMLSTDLETGNIATVEGSDIAVDVEDAVTVNNANILVADVQASNGIIHIIDRVIVPPTPEADAEVESEVPEAAIQ